MSAETKPTVTVTRQELEKALRVAERMIKFSGMTVDNPMAALHYRQIKTLVDRLDAANPVSPEPPTISIVA